MKIVKKYENLCKSINSIKPIYNECNDSFGEEFYELNQMPTNYMIENFNLYERTKKINNYLKLAGVSLIFAIGLGANYLFDKYKENEIKFVPNNKIHKSLFERPNNFNLEKKIKKIFDNNRYN